jgi:hypothetical protein
MPEGQLGFGDVHEVEWEDDVEALNLKIAELEIRLEDMSFELRALSGGRRVEELKAEGHQKREELLRLQEKLRVAMEKRGQAPTSVPPGVGEPSATPESPPTMPKLFPASSEPLAVPSESPEPADLSDEDIEDLIRRPLEDREPDDPHEVARVFREQGYVLLYSIVLKGRVAWVASEEHKSKVPEGFTVYTEEELKELAKLGDPSEKVTHTLRLVHEAKKLGNGEVSKVLKSHRESAV